MPVPSLQPYARPTAGSSQAALSKMLHQSVMESHKLLEESAFARSLSQGTVDLTRYGMYLADLFVIYQELETQLAQFKHTDQLGALYIPPLFRSASLLDDMTYFNVAPESAGAAAREYQSRLREIGETAPHLLIAHAYTRYLGDLFGGQIVKNKLEERFGGGTRFYHFEDLAEAYSLQHAQRFVTPFRKILDALPLTAREADEVVAEAVKAFEMHNPLFRELSDPPMSRWIYAFCVPLLCDCDPRRLLSSLKFWE